MLTLFPQTISVLLPLLLSIHSFFGCSKKKTSPSKASKESSAASTTTKNREKKAEKSKIEKPETIRNELAIRTDEKRASKIETVDKKPEKKQIITKKKKSGEKAKSEQDTQKIELETSLKAQKSNLKTAEGSVMMGTVREPSKMVKAPAASGGGGDGGGGDDGGYEKLGDMSADELKKIAEAAPA